MEDLIELEAVIRRVVAARVNDAHLVEDLTQETLVHVAAADPQLGPGARQAYAIVTARNLVVSHARSEAVHDRHAHRLVDYTNLDGPEELTLEREETEALTEALQCLEPEDRQLLVRHEAGGTSLDDLAAEAGTTHGAVAMRLARTRALLRVEFLLAFRRVELPTKQCRPVLIALSAGDRRTQHRLHAAEHLLQCSTCAQLAQPVTERRRGIAAWLLVPLGEAIRRAIQSLRRNHLTQLAAAAAIAVAATVAILVINTDHESAATPSPPTTDAAAPRPAVSAAPPPAAPSPPAPAPATPAGCPPPAPLTPNSTVGCPIADTHLTATDVPADEAFWAQTSDGQTIWVQLIGNGESPIDIHPGAALIVAGTLQPPPPNDPIATDPRIQATGRILTTPYDAIRPG